MPHAPSLTREAGEGGECSEPGGGNYRSTAPTCFRESPRRGK